MKLFKGLSKTTKLIFTIVGATVIVGVCIGVWYLVKPHEHSYKDIVTPPTCIEKGFTTHTCECGDSYVDSYVRRTEHSRVVDKPVEPTCTQTCLSEGEHCSYCNRILIEQKIIKAKGHTYINWIEIDAPTCMVNGRESSVCSVCEDRKSVV